MIEKLFAAMIALSLMGNVAWAFGTGHGGGTPLPEPQIGKFRQGNSDNIDRLKKGMGEKEVSGLMYDRQDVQTYNLSEKAEVLSNPVRVESVSGMDGRKRNIRYYYAYQKKSDMKITTDELCPVIFSGGTLEGWGWEYYEKVIGPAPVDP